MDVIFLQVKSSIVKQLSAVQVETVERIQQTSNVIAEAVSIVNEVTVETQVYVAYNLLSLKGKASELCSQSFPIHHL